MSTVYQSTAGRKKKEKLRQGIVYLALKSKIVYTEIVNNATSAEEIN
jgi:hypothetical protein